MMLFKKKLTSLSKNKLQKKKKPSAKDWKPPVSPGKAAWQKRKLRRKKYKLIKEKRRKKWVKFRRKMRLKRSRNRRVMRSVHVFNSKLKFRRPISKHFAKLFKKILVLKTSNNKLKYLSKMFYRPFIKFKIGHLSLKPEIESAAPNTRINFFKKAALNTTRKELDEYAIPSEAFIEALPIVPKTESFDRTDGLFYKKIRNKKRLYNNGLKAELKLYKILEDNEKASKWMSNVKTRRKDKTWRLKQWRKLSCGRVRVGKRVSPAVAQANAYRQPIRRFLPIFRNQFSNLLYSKRLKLITSVSSKFLLPNVNYLKVNNMQFQQERKVLTRAKPWYIISKSN